MPMAILRMTRRSAHDFCAGISPLSHKKKARFWRALVEMFPNVIDYLCALTAQCNTFIIAVHDGATG